MVGKELLEILGNSNKPFSNFKGGVSNIETNRRTQLLKWQEEGKISELKTQYRFSIHVNNQFICNYYADFIYKYEGKTIVEDTKNGAITAVFMIKQKLMKAVYDIDVIVVTDAKQLIGVKNEYKRREHERYGDKGREYGR